MAGNAPGDELCGNPQCWHAKDDHVRPGLCEGLGPEKGMLGSFCICPGFKPTQQRANAYSTWDPEKDKRGAREMRFSRTSGANEIGDGKLRRRASHQDEQLTHLPENPVKKRDPKNDVPEWVMFGVRHDDGTVTIHASTGLSYIKLRQDPSEFDRLHRKLIKDGILTESPWDLNARLVGTMEMDAPDYVEALRRLMGAGWQNGGTSDPGPSTADLQRQAALEDAQQAERERTARERHAIEAPVDEIIDAEIVEED